MKNIYKDKRLKAVIDSFLSQFKDKPFEAAVLIGQMRRGMIDQAVDLLSDSQANIRETACYILSELEAPNDTDTERRDRYKQGVAEIERLLAEDRNSSVRAAAATALGKIRFTLSLPSLLRAVNDKSTNVRFDVAAALGSFGTDMWEGEGAHYKTGVTNALLHLMGDKNDKVRDWATFGIHQGAHDTPITRALLWQALDDPNGDVRGEAAVALAIFNDLTFIPRLGSLLRNSNPISTNYFEAAEEFQDPVLLPAVLAGAERWRTTLKDGEEMHLSIVSAIESLSEKNTIS